jgi:hypothetical protein
MKREDTYYDKVAGFAENLSLTAMVTYLNLATGLTKRTGEKFEVTDVQGYVRRNHLPEHMGNLLIETRQFNNVKLYTISNKQWESKM